MKWTDIIPWVLTFLALVFGAYQYFRRNKDKKKEKTAELEAVDEFENGGTKGDSQEWEFELKIGSGFQGCRPVAFNTIMGV